MSIQSLSIVVPAVKCINNCRFCVSHMRKEEYKDQLDQNLPFYDLYFDDYKVPDDTPDSRGLYVDKISQDIVDIP